MKKIHLHLLQGALPAENEYRDIIDMLRSRLNLLTGKDKLLMTMYLECGNSFRQMARLSGVNDTIIARRIRRLTKRLTEGEYISCLRNRTRLTAAEMAIARDYFLMGLSIKKIAAQRRLTYYRVSRTLKRIRQVISATQQYRRRAGDG